MFTIASQSTFLKTRKKNILSNCTVKKKKKKFPFHITEKQQQKTTIYEKASRILFMLHMYKKALKLRIHQ